MKPKNETEAATLGLFDFAQTAVVPNVCQTIVMTLGSKGALLISNNELQKEIAAFPIEVVDSTAAGDAFNGALAVALVNGRSLPNAITFANAAGAQRSLPILIDVEHLLSVGVFESAN